MVGHEFEPTTNLGQVILFVTFLVSTIAQWMRDRRARRWQIEDKKQQDDALKQHEETMKKKLDEQTAAINKNVEERTNRLRKRLNGLLEPEDLL